VACVRSWYARSLADIRRFNFSDRLLDQQGGAARRGVLTKCDHKEDGMRAAPFNGRAFEQLDEADVMRTTIDARISVVTIVVSGPVRSGRAGPEAPVYTTGPKLNHESRAPPTLMVEPPQSNGLRPHSELKMLHFVSPAPFIAKRSAACC